LQIEMMHKNNITFTHVTASDYDQRFLDCVELVQNMLGNKHSIIGH